MGTGHPNPNQLPQSRRRFRHFAGTRDGCRHGEPGCEDLTFETLRRIGDVAKDLGRPLADVAIAWLLSRTSVASVIVGARKPEQLQRNCAAADLDLSEEVLARLNAVTEPLKSHFGTNADLWEGDARSRIR